MHSISDTVLGHLVCLTYVSTVTMETHILHRRKVTMSDEMSPTQSLLDSMESMKTPSKNKLEQPLFTTEDLLTTQDTLAQMLRYICITENITKQSFKKSFYDLAQTQAMPTNQTCWTFTNIMKSLYNPSITWQYFEKFLQIIGYSIADINFILTDTRKQEVVKYSRSDAVHLVEKEQPENVQVKEVVIY